MFLGLILALAQGLRNEIHTYSQSNYKMSHNMFDNWSYRFSSLIEVNFCRWRKSERGKILPNRKIQVNFICVKMINLLRTSKKHFGKWYKKMEITAKLYIRYFNSLAENKRELRIEKWNFSWLEKWYFIIIIIIMQSWESYVESVCHVVETIWLSFWPEKLNFLNSPQSATDKSSDRLWRVDGVRPPHATRATRTRGVCPFTWNVTVHLGREHALFFLVVYEKVGEFLRAPYKILEIICCRWLHLFSRASSEVNDPTFWGPRVPHVATLTNTN